MSDHVYRRLRWFLLLDVILLLCGMTLNCVVALRTSAWIDDAEARPLDYLSSGEESDRWSASVDFDNMLLRWGLTLVPLGMGTLVGAIASLAWVTKGRFRLRSLFMGITIAALAIGIPLAQVGPRLHNPQFVYRPQHMDVSFEQHGKPASNSTHSVINRRSVVYAVAPLLVVPIIFIWPRRVRRSSTD